LKALISPTNILQPNIIQQHLKSVPNNKKQQKKGGWTFWRIKIATVLESSEPVSMMRRQRGIISVESRNSIVGGESDFTSAPMTPREVRRRYSNGRDLEVVLRKGYRKSGMCAAC
jgi:hypothetical protein